MSVVGPFSSDAAVQQFVGSLGYFEHRRPQAEATRLTQGVRPTGADGRCTLEAHKETALQLTRLGHVALQRPCYQAVSSAIFIPSLYPGTKFRIDSLRRLEDCAGHRNPGDGPMLDAFYIVLGTALFAALALYARACDWL